MALGWGVAGGVVNFSAPPLSLQLAEAKASERRLQLRVKNLTAELASCKRG